MSTAIDRLRVLGSPLLYNDRSAASVTPRSMRKERRGNKTFPLNSKYDRGVNRLQLSSRESSISMVSKRVTFVFDNHQGEKEEDEQQFCIQGKTISNNDQYYPADDDELSTFSRGSSSQMSSWLQYRAGLGRQYTDSRDRLSSKSINSEYHDNISLPSLPITASSASTAPSVGTRKSMNSFDKLTVHRPLELNGHKIPSGAHANPMYAYVGDYTDDDFLFLQTFRPKTKELRFKKWDYSSSLTGSDTKGLQLCLKVNKTGKGPHTEESSQYVLTKKSEKQRRNALNNSSVISRNTNSRANHRPSFQTLESYVNFKDNSYLLRQAKKHTSFRHQDFSVIPRATPRRPTTMGDVLTVKSQQSFLS